MAPNLHDDDAMSSRLRSDLTPWFSFFFFFFSLFLPSLKSYTHPHLLYAQYKHCFPAAMTNTSVVHE